MCTTEEAFSSIDLVCQCLIDEPRTNAFKNAIEAVVNKDSIVVDVGSGSAVLALFAARARANKVFALEYDDYISKIAKNNIAINGYADVIKLLKGDACSYEYPNNRKINVVVMEMLTTALVDENQVRAINNIHRQGILSANAIFIPHKVNTYVALSYKDFSMYGFQFKMVKHLWNNLSENQKIRLFSDRVLLNSVDFTAPIVEDFISTVSFVVTESGVINSLYLSSRTFLLGQDSIGDTETLNAPVIFPFQDMEVKSGDIVKLKIQYRFGGGYKNFKVKVIK